MGAGIKVRARIEATMQDFSAMNEFMTMEELLGMEEIFHEPREVENFVVCEVDGEIYEAALHPARRYTYKRTQMPDSELPSVINQLILEFVEPTPRQRLMRQIRNMEINRECYEDVGIILQYSLPTYADFITDDEEWIEPYGIALDHKMFSLYLPL